MNNKPELLSPAGGMAQLKAAVQSGADAVYLGAPQFSARAGADNFSFDELKAAVSYCRMYNVKVHCALNTLIKENELGAAVDAAKEIYYCGVDALIVQDLGLAAHIKKIMPDMELHASTQMTVTSLEGVRYLEDKGFDRVVLARELSMHEIERIVKGAKAEIEVFAHGALCMCYSGQCLMSSVLGGRSGNRGRCAQPCRLCYSLLEDGKKCAEAYVLSPKDMALVNHLGELKKIGVASLKIEGRLKSAEYVSAVTGIYRKYLDNTVPVSDSDMSELINAFSRSGFTDGYFTERIGAQMMSHKNPSNNSCGIYTAHAKERAAGKTVRRIPIHIFASLTKGDVLHLSAYDDDGNYACSDGGETARETDGRPLERDRLVSQLSKLGQTPFCTDDICVECDENITISVKDINDTRRRLCTELEAMRAQLPERRALSDDAFGFGSGAKESGIYLSAEVMNFEQGLAALECPSVRRIYAPPRVAVQLLEHSDGKAEIVTKTADIFKEEEIKTDSVSVSSTAALYHYGARAKYGDFRLNVFNSLTANEFPSLKCITLSPELNLHEIKDVTEHIKDDIETEIIGYGRLPLMMMKNCPVKAMCKCNKGKGTHSLKDRKNLEFPIICSPDCRAILLNSKPIFIADMMEEIKKIKINCIRLNFTVENFQQCGKIVSVYHAALNTAPVKPMAENTFTRGHLRRGVI